MDGLFPYLAQMITITINKKSKSLVYYLLDGDSE